jgi:DNA gyrase subunit B
LGDRKYGLQRYKCLGEMNPESRTLKLVRIADAAIADQTFSMLMGNEVLPRRIFIQSHAREVQNLDV